MPRKPDRIINRKDTSDNRSTDTGNQQKCSNSLAHAIALHQQGELQEAKKIYETILNESGSCDAFHLLGVIYLQEKNYQKASAFIGKALGINPNNSNYHYNFGLAQQELNLLESAINSYNQAIALRPDYGMAYSNRGAIEIRLKQHKAALISYNSAIQYREGCASDYSNRAAVLLELRLWEQSLEDCNMALSLDPGLVQAYFNKGNALLALNQRQLAKENYEQALLLNPQYAEAWGNHGILQLSMQLTEKGISSIDQALRIKPDMPFLFGHRVLASNAICEWSRRQEHVAKIETQINNFEAVAEPFCLLSLTDNPALQLQAAKIWIEKQYPLAKTDAAIAEHPAPPPSGLPARPAFATQLRHRKIRVGYISADFREHAASYNMAGVFENISKEHFEIFAFSIGKKDSSSMQARIARAFNQFIEVAASTNEEIVALMQDMEIDIAVDIMGATEGHRTDVFALRAAPIQVNHYGFTSGSGFMDYIIADITALPPEIAIHFSEKPVYLPHTHFPTDDSRQIAENTTTRNDEGLPAGGFVFCAFNNSYKISPEAFAAWMRLLRRVEGSVLWLRESQPAAVANLRREAHRFGIEPTRLVFAKFSQKMEDHLARHRVADLFLDTFPFNAQTTASDALWAGLPLVTVMGKTMPGRVAASLLKALQLPELVAESLEEYEYLAFTLATNPGLLNDARRKLEKNRQTAPLFNTRLYTANLEKAYKAMYERNQMGLPPKPIDLKT